MKMLVINKDKVVTVGRDNAIRALLQNLRLELSSMIGDVRGNKCLVITAEIKTEASAKKEMPNEPKPKSTKTKPDDTSDGDVKSSSDNSKSKDGSKEKDGDAGKGDKELGEIKDPLKDMSPEK